MAEKSDWKCKKSFIDIDHKTKFIKRCNTMYRSLAYKSGVGQEKEDSVGKGKKKRKDVDLCKYSVVRKREDER